MVSRTASVLTTPEMSHVSSRCVFPTMFLTFPLEQHPSVWAAEHTPQAGGIINNRHSFLTILEAGCARWRHEQVSCSWLLDGIFWLCPHMMEGVRGLPGAYFIRALSPPRGSPLGPHQRLRVPYPDTIVLGVRRQYRNIAHKRSV